MKRYLMKLNGKAISYMQVPKGARLERNSKTSSELRVVKGSKVGVWHKGYKVIKATTANKATEKFLDKKIRVHKKPFRR